MQKNIMLIVCAVTVVAVTGIFFQSSSKRGLTFNMTTQEFSLYLSTTAEK